MENLEVLAISQYHKYYIDKESKFVYVYTIESGLFYGFGSLQHFMAKMITDNDLQEYNNRYKKIMENVMVKANENEWVSFNSKHFVDMWL